MSPVNYNQQTARSVYIWGFLTGTDLMVIIGAFSLNMITVSETLVNFLIFGGYPIYLITLRVGRKPGYDWHFFSSLLQSKTLRPGRRPFRYPVVANPSKQ